MVTGYKNGILWSLSQDQRDVLEHLYRICIEASQKSVSWKKNIFKTHILLLISSVYKRDSES